MHVTKSKLKQIVLEEYRALLKERVLFTDEGGDYTDIDDTIAAAMAAGQRLPTDWQNSITNSIVAQTAREYAGSDPVSKGSLARTTAIRTPCGPTCMAALKKYGINPVKTKKGSDSSDVKL